MADEPHGDTTDAGFEQQPMGDYVDSNDADEPQPQEQGEQAPMTRDEISKLVADQGQRIADRQVNALMKRLDQQGQGKTKQRSDNTSNDSTSGDRDRASQERFDEREARMAYREYLNDSHTFVDASERSVANSLGTALVGAELAEHGDPDRAGRQAATQVAEQLSAYRKAVEDATINRLKRRGALVTEPGRGGDSPPSGAAPTQSTTGDLRTSARDMAAEFNKELGHPA